MKRRNLLGRVWPVCGVAAAVTLAGWPVLNLAKAEAETVAADRNTFLVLALLTLGFGLTDYGWRAFSADLKESVRIAAAQIRANKIRSALTALGVIIGIVAVTLMGTAIAGLGVVANSSLAGFGDDVLFVTKMPWSDVNDRWLYRNRRDILTTYVKPMNEWIAAHPEGPLKVAVPDAHSFTSVVREDYRVNPIWLMGTSADYIRTARSDMKEGRFFSELEEQAARNVVVIGYDVADALFPNSSPLGQTVRVGGHNFEVVGVAARQGSFLGLFSWDSRVVMPVSVYRRYFTPNDAADLDVQVDTARMAEARDELRGLMRRIRQLDPAQKDDFEVNGQATIREQLDKLESLIALAGFLITGLALFVGAIGIMNITYVSVKERTKEIGTRKALGARRRTILLQFLIEAVAICMMGGLLGLALTAGLAAAIGALAPSLPVVFPFWLVLLSLGAAVATGIVSGFLPAWAASKLDPVVALRYE